MIPVNIYNQMSHIQCYPKQIIWNEFGVPYRGKYLDINISNAYQYMKECALSNHVQASSTPQIPIKTIRDNIQGNPNQNNIINGIGIRTSNLVQSFTFNVDKF